MDSQVFEPVWYLPSENRWRDRNPLAFRDVGRLVVSEHAIAYQGRGYRFVASHIRSVSIGKQGRDFINDWVKVEYGPGPTPATAFFADGRWLGWGGVLGGTKKILVAVLGTLG
jgi:hypothetical protein